MMLALAKKLPGVDGLEVVHREANAPGAGEILIAVKAAGICGTDMQIYHWSQWMQRRMRLPRVLGHEGAGVVVQLGAGVKEVAVGDRVALESHIFCSRCFQCRTERAHLCPHTRYPGVDIDGVFAQYVTVPAAIAWVIKPELSFEKAAALEPLGVAVHATTVGTGVAGQSVLVNGCGPIGLMNIAVARILGAEKIIAADPLALRRNAAARMGADQVVDPMKEDLGANAKSATQERGVDVVFEYSGRPEGLHAAVSALTPGGELRLCGTPSAPAEVDFGLWRSKRPTIHNIHGRRIWSTWVKASEMLERGRLDLGPVLSHVMPLSEARSAFELILRGEACKPILIP
jgi:threonine 3-dehydrogenase